VPWLVYVSIAATLLRGEVGLQGACTGASLLMKNCLVALMPLLNCDLPILM